MKSIDGMVRRTTNDRLDYVSFPKSEPVRKPRAAEAEELFSHTPRPNHKPKQRKSAAMFGKLFLSSLAVGVVLYGSGHMRNLLNSAAAITGEGTNLDTPALSTKVVQNYLAANVEIDPFVGKDNSSDDNFKMYRCTGTSIGHGEVSTAAHCLRYLTSDSSATPQQPMEESVIVNGDYRFYADEHEQYYPDYRPDSRVHDVEVIDTSGGLPDSVPLATAAPKVGAPIYFESRYGDANAQIFGGRVIETPDTQSPNIMSLFPVTNPKRPVCIHGTSGTGVIDQSGDLVGTLVAGTKPFPLGLSDATVFGISSRDVGEDVQMCIIVPTDTLRPLTERGQ